jgi:hypothetical protein
MSEWINHVKAYAEKNNITYKQALKDASPSYKTRNEKKPEEIPIIEPTIKVLKKEEPIKFTRKNTTKKVVENITLKL